MASRTPLDKKHSPLKSTARGQNFYVGLWVGGTLGLMGLLVGAFFVGRSLGASEAPEVRAVIESERQEPPIVFPSLTGGPQNPGVWAWDVLRGGECLALFDNAFAEEFEVVDCSAPHLAQLVRAQLVSRDRTENFPGEPAMAIVAQDICDVLDVIDTEYAQRFATLVKEIAYPVTADQWHDGQRVVYCFMRSSTGEIFEATLLDHR
ncbi:MAG: hypothetical protein ACJAV4_000225 [Pontimonas sp.]